jgi:hypothetical protein
MVHDDCHDPSVEPRRIQNNRKSWIPLGEKIICNIIDNSHVLYEGGSSTPSYSLDCTLQHWPPKSMRDLMVMRYVESRSLACKSKESENEYMNKRIAGSRRTYWMRLISPGHKRYNIHPELVEPHGSWGESKMSIRTNGVPHGFSPLSDVGWNGGLWLTYVNWGRKCLGGRNEVSWPWNHPLLSKGQLAASIISKRPKHIELGWKEPPYETLISARNFVWIIPDWPLGGRHCVFA